MIPNQNQNLSPIINIHPRKPFPHDTHEIPRTTCYIPPHTPTETPEQLRAKLLEMTHPPIANDLVTINDEINNLRSNPQNINLLKHPNVFSFAIADKNWDLLSWTLLHQVIHTNDTPVLNLANCTLTPDEFKELLVWLPSYPGNLSLNLTGLKFKHSSDDMHIDVDIYISKDIDKDIGEGIGEENIHADANLNPEEMQKIFDALSNTLKTNSNLIELNLKEFNIGIAGAQKMSQCLKYNTTLVKLDLEGCGIGPKGAIAFSEILEFNATLREINFASNQIGYFGAKAMGKALTNNDTLSVVNLANNGIGKDGAKVIAGGLIKNSGVASLNLSGNKFGDKGVKILCEAMQSHPKLTSVSFANCDIQESGAKAIGDVLNTTKLAEIHLEDNKIGNNGVIAISIKLDANNTLTTLNLANNQIGMEGAQALCNALRGKWKAIASLNLSDNLLGGDEKESEDRRIMTLGRIELSKSITALIQNTPTLTTLLLANCRLDVVGLLPICNAVNSNIQLTELDLSANDLGNAGAKIISTMLNENTALTTLRLAQTGINDQNIDLICKALTTGQPNLEWLDLSNNDLSADGVGKIGGALFVYASHGKNLAVDVSRNKSYNQAPKTILTKEGIVN